MQEINSEAYNKTIDKFNNIFKGINALWSERFVLNAIQSGLSGSLKIDYPAPSLEGVVYDLYCLCLNGQL